MSSTSRRRVLAGMASAAAAAALGVPAYRVLRQPATRVTTLRAPTYDADLADLLQRAVRTYPDVVRRAAGARVVLKPNLVEWDPVRPINTDPRFVVAVAEAFRSLGAGEVLVAEGPGHRRDTELLVEQTGLHGGLGSSKVRFVDLNVDETRRVALPTNYTGMGALRLGATAAAADLLVSVPKLKTHHWTGVTLSMKNLFGTVPGSVYGWPKNVLHTAGIEQSIVDIWAALRPGFAIVDGIVGMDGDGPLRGSARPVGMIVLGDNLPAVDATCARLMGIDPDRVPHLRVAAEHGGTIASSRISVEGDALAPQRFALPAHLQPLAL